MRRSAIVTGASRGIGRRIAESLAREGFDVTATARNEELLGSLSKANEGAPGMVRTFLAEVRDENYARHVLDFHLQTADSIDLIVIASGVGTAQPLTGLGQPQVERMLAINFLGPLSLVLKAKPYLAHAAEKNGSARVCFLGSTTGIAPEPNLAAYAASKAALASFARSINLEWGKESIYATTISPGYVDTDLTEWVRDTITPQEMIQVSDIAEIVMSLTRLGNTAVLQEIVVTRPGAEGIRA
jgi:3-oxoacyl-[acyl-carrier protein] reductase